MHENFFKQSETQNPYIGIKNTAQNLSVNEVHLRKVQVRKGLANLKQSKHLSHTGKYLNMNSSKIM